MYLPTWIFVAICATLFFFVALTILLRERWRTYERKYHGACSEIHTLRNRLDEVNEAFCEMAEMYEEEVRRREMDPPDATHTEPRPR